MFELMELAQQPEWKQILVDVVKKEEMNPWDVDIALITDKFMGELRELKKFDFRIPANAILASSILLRFKSDSWTVTPILEDMFQPMYIPDQIIQEPYFPDLQPVFRETRRKVTLNELIDAIEDVMQKEKVKAGKQRGKVKTEIPQTLIDLVDTQSEDFDKRLAKVYIKIKEKADKENLLTFSNLINGNSVNEFVNHFVPVLHLANQGSLSVWQEERFGEIFIHILDKKVKENAKESKKAS